MDCLTLLSDARAAGLAVTRDGAKLVIEGPPSAESIAMKLIEHKRAVIALLECEACEWTEFIEQRGGRSLRVIQRTGEVVELWNE